MSQRLIAILSILSKLIVSRYVAELITTDAGRFGYVGFVNCAYTKLFLYAVDKGLKNKAVVETSCISCY